MKINYLVEYVVGLTLFTRSKVRECQIKSLKMLDHKLLSAILDRLINPRELDQVSVYSLLKSIVRHSILITNEILKSDSISIR